MGCTNASLTPREQVQGQNGVRLVMGKYAMKTSQENLMGEGASSLCYKATTFGGGDLVAIKVHKVSHHGRKSKEVILKKFLRQVQVLMELQTPFTPPTESTLWHEALATAKPSELFLQLIDYSKDADGNPGPDPDDNVTYVVTELGQYTLKDHLKRQRVRRRALPEDEVRATVRAVVLVVAGLHAKGLVHLDLKPENLMMFHGRWKLIDVDGCMRVGSTVSVNDSTVSYSPCYCAPEWSNFLTNRKQKDIDVVTALDVWSVGMTLCELLNLDVVLKPRFASFLATGQSRTTAETMFAQWLGRRQNIVLPKPVLDFDENFSQLVLEWLLVCDQSQRRTLAQCLSHPFIKNFESKSPMKRCPRRKMSWAHSEDRSIEAPLKMGTLWKLNQDGNPNDDTHWLRHDMWITRAGKMCYFSMEDNKRLVLFGKLSGGQLHRFDTGAKHHAFEVSVAPKAGFEYDSQWGYTVLACDSPEEYSDWTMHLGQVFGLPISRQVDRIVDYPFVFKLAVKNRRRVVDDDACCQPEGFNAKLWKLSAGGDRTHEKDWFLRDAWLAKDGSLVYWSQKEKRSLAYYTAHDIARATVTKCGENSFRPFSFQVNIASMGSIEFATGEFAADSAITCERWIAEITRFMTV